MFSCEVNLLGMSELGVLIINIRDVSDRGMGPILAQYAGSDISGQKNI